MDQGLGCVTFGRKKYSIQVPYRVINKNPHCTYIYMYVCMYIHMYISISTTLYISIYIYVYACMSVPYTIAKHYICTCVKTHLYCLYKDYRVKGAVPVFRSS